MKILLSLIICATFSIVSYSQNDCPKITHKNGHILSITGFNSSAKSDPTCRVHSFTGVIKSLTYNNDDSIKPATAILELPDRRRVEIILDEDTENCLSEAEKSNWEAQLKKNVKVTIKAWQCGAGGHSDLSIFSIVFL